jgi:hypothetical protein
MTASPLEYESTIDAGAVVIERTEEGISINIPPTVPDRRMMRRLSNRAAIFAGWMTALLMIPFACVLMPLIVPRGRWLVLPSLLLDLVLLFFALGIYLSLWQSNSRKKLIGVVRALRQSCEIRVAGDTISIKSAGPYGATDRVIPRKKLSDVGYFAVVGMSSLLIRLDDGEEIQILPDRTLGEYQTVVSALRDALGMVKRGV